MKADYLRLLERSFEERRSRNPRFSQRAFAAQLGVDSGNLSRILRGRASLSPERAAQFVDALALEPAEARVFLHSVAEEGARRAKGRTQAQMRRDLDQAPYELSSDLYKAIGEWYHYAILELTQTRDFSPQPRHIARRLGIPPQEARAAVERLLRLGLLVAKGGTLRRAHGHFTNKDKHAVTTDGIKRHLRGMFEKAIVSLESDPLDERAMLAITIPASKTAVPTIKRRIESFLSEIADLGMADGKEQVYELVVGYFPLEARTTKTEEP